MLENLIKVRQHPNNNKVILKNASANACSRSKTWMRSLYCHFGFVVHKYRPLFWVKGLTVRVKNSIRQEPFKFWISEKILISIYLYVFFVPFIYIWFMTYISGISRVQILVSLKKRNSTSSTVRDMAFERYPQKLSEMFLYDWHFFAFFIILNGVPDFYLRIDFGLMSKKILELEFRRPDFPWLTRH